MKIDLLTELEKLRTHCDRNANTLWDGPYSFRWFADVLGGLLETYKKQVAIEVQAVRLDDTIEHNTPIQDKRDSRSTR